MRVEKIEGGRIEVTDENMEIVTTTYAKTWGDFVVVIADINLYIRCCGGTKKEITKTREIKINIDEFNKERYISEIQKLIEDIVGKYKKLANIYKVFEELHKEGWLYDVIYTTD